MLKREHREIPIPEEVIGRFGGKQVFSMFEQNDSFWQVLRDRTVHCCGLSAPLLEDIVSTEYLSGSVRQAK